MKKLLLLLLCVPLIVFGQTNYKNWEDVYSHQKHDNLNFPENILEEFGVLKWNTRYNRNESILKLDAEEFKSSSWQTIFLEGFDGNVYTYIHDIRLFDGNKALVILYSIGYTKYGEMTSGCKYDREEVHFVLMERNQLDMWDVKKTRTMDIHTSDDGWWSIDSIEYIDINDIKDEEKRFIDLGLNNKWVLHVNSSGGHMGEYWNNYYCYVLKDLTCVTLYEYKTNINWYQHGDGWDIESERNYVNGVLISEDCYNENGESIECE